MNRHGPLVPNKQIELEQPGVVLEVDVLVVVDDDVLVDVDVLLLV